MAWSLHTSFVTVVKVPSRTVALLAPVPPPTVLTDAFASALLALVALATMLTDGTPPALLAPAALPAVLAGGLRHGGVALSVAHA